MTDIRELVEILDFLGGEADLDNICKIFQKKHHMIVFSEHKALIESILEQNPADVYFISESQKWKTVKSKSSPINDETIQVPFTKYNFEDLYQKIKFVPRRDKVMRQINTHGLFWFETNETAKKSEKCAMMSTNQAIILYNISTGIRVMELWLKEYGADTVININTYNLLEKGFNYSVKKKNSSRITLSLFEEDDKIISITNNILDIEAHNIMSK